MHVPKTGGTFVLHNLNAVYGDPDYVIKQPFKMEHCAPQKHQATPGIGVFDPTVIKNTHRVFTVVRHPFELLASNYFHLDIGWMYQRRIMQTKSFKDFVMKFCDSNFKWWNPHFQDFMYYALFDRNNNLIPETVIRNEFLSQELAVLFKEHGLLEEDDSLPNLSTSKNKSVQKWNRISSSRLYSKERDNRDYFSLYDNEMTDAMLKKTKLEFDTFGFTMERRYENGTIPTNSIKRQTQLAHSKNS